MSTELSGVNTKKSRQHLWLVSELFYPETISTGYIMTEIAKSLVKRYNVSVISGPEFYEKKTKNKTVLPLENIDVHRITSKGYNKNSVASRIFGHLSVTLKMFFLMKKKIPKGAQVLMVTNPVLLLISVVFFAKRKAWDLKVLVHDVFPENLVVSGVLKSKRSFIFSFFKRIFNTVFQKINTLIVLGRDMETIFEQKKGTKKGITIIENWADTKNINARQLTEEKTVNFLFAGNMGRLQGLDALLEAIKKASCKSAAFTFIGSGALDTYIDDFLVQNTHLNIKKLGWIDRSEQDMFMADATIGVVTLKKGMYGLGVPSKFYNLLAAGKPIFYIGDYDSEIHQVLKENDIGWYAEAGNIDMISEVIQQIAETNIETIKQYSINARALAESTYSKPIILEKFNRLFAV